MPLKIRRCEMYNYTVPTKPFTFFSTKQTFNIRPENRNRTSVLKVQTNLVQGLIITGVHIVTSKKQV